MKRNYDIRWQAPTALGNCIAEQRVVVVGGTGGLGRALALQLASLGARVTVIGRTFRDADTPGITFLPADLSLMREARRVAALLPAETLDMLIFSAGLFAAPQRQHTAEGIEHDLALGFLSRLVMLRALVPRLGKRARARPRIFVLGYPGAGPSGQIGDLNAKHTQRTVAPRQHAVAGNEMLVLDSASQYPQAVFFGLHPGRIKTDRLRHGGLRARLAAWLRGGAGHSADDYARHITPLLFSRDIAQYNGAMFNNKGQAILPSEGLSKEHIHQFMAAASALIGRTSKESIMSKAFESVRLGPYTLKNRLVMAPMTRSRAQPDGTPGALAADYYAQRASIGLMVAEGTQPSDDGQGYLATPGIYTDAHVSGWRKVTAAVHDQGGRIFIQLMHAGRMSHPDNTPHHRQAVAPSAIASGSGMFTATGMQDIPAPRALSVEEIRQTVQDFRHAARRAIDAGADDVEIHGANAYLIQQFFAPSANLRTDEYGGTLENRARFALEVAAAVAAEIGPERTAIRLSPGTTMWGIAEGDEGPALYRHLVAQLDKLGLAYLHLMHQGDEVLLHDLRALWHGTLMLNRPGRPREQIGADLASGLADLESYGQLVLANPDLVTRLQSGAPLNEANRNAYFGGGAPGYTDYPALGA